MRAIQFASAEAVHAHSGVVVNVTCSLPPADSMAVSGTDRVSPHLTTDDGDVEVVTSVEPHAETQAAHTAASTACTGRRESRLTLASKPIN